MDLRSIHLPHHIASQACHRHAAMFTSVAVKNEHTLQAALGVLVRQWEATAGDEVVAEEPERPLTAGVAQILLLKGGM